MTDAPKTIFVKCPNKDSAGLAFSVQSRPPFNRTEYTLTTHSDALVAAAYEDAQKRPAQRCAECDCNGGGENCNWIKTVSRTPANAQAAYDAAIAQARREGWEAAQAENAKLREALNVIATHRAKCHEYDTDCGHEKRSFDEEDVRLMEWQAKSALSGQDAEEET